MKYLRLIDHQGNKQYTFQVFVEGQDFKWEAPTPVAVWLGKIELVDKIPEFKPEVEAGYEAVIASVNVGIKEVLGELETVCTESSRDEGVNSPEQPEGIEKLPEDTAGREVTRRDKKHK